MRISAQASSCYKADDTQPAGPSVGAVLLVLLLVVGALGAAGAVAYGLRTGKLQGTLAALSVGMRARTSPSASSTRVDIGAPPLQSTPRAPLTANDSAGFATEYTPPSGAS